MNHSDIESQVEVLYWEEADAQPHPATSHTEHVLSFHVAGILEMDHGQPLQAGPGAITILPAGVPHRTLGGKGIALWLVRFCAVCHGLDESDPIMAVFRRVRLGALPVVHVAPEQQAHLTRLLEELRREGTQRTPESGAVIKALILLILAEANRAMRGSQEATGLGTGSLVADALTFIQANCLFPISLKDVAAAVNRAPAHVATTLKKRTGFSVGRWINSGRLAEAARRLVHTDDPMEQIAEHVGWRDVTHFIRQFRKYHGQTPAAWRSERRKPHKSD